MAPGDRNRSKSMNGAKEVNYRGVRKRSGGRYGAAIRDPFIKKRRWLGTFNTGEEAARAYDNAARNLKGAKARTNFPAPSPHLDTVHIQRCTTADTTRLHIPLLPSPPANQGNNNMSPSGTTITIPNNLIDYAILLQQQPLWGAIVGPQMIKRPNGHEWVGAGVVKNILPTSSLQISVCDSSSSSAVDTQLSSLDLNPATKERLTQRSFDLNLPAPGEEDDEDQCSPSLSFSLGPKH